jgi:hypothetical protein
VPATTVPDEVLLPLDIESIDALGERLTELGAPGRW